MRPDKRKPHKRDRPGDYGHPYVARESVFGEEVFHVRRSSVTFCAVTSPAPLATAILIRTYRRMSEGIGQRKSVWALPFPTIPATVWAASLATSAKAALSSESWTLIVIKSVATRFAPASTRARSSINSRADDPS